MTPLPTFPLLLLLLLLPLLFLAACGGGSGPGPGRAPASGPGGDGPPLVVTTFHPTEYLAARIAGDLATVVCDLPPGGDALFWTPDDGALRRMQGADLIVLNGAGMEAWREHVSLPEARVVDSSAAFAQRFLEFAQPLTHSHEPQGRSHTHQGLDAHVWMDPLNALEQARAIHAGLLGCLGSLGEEARDILDGNLASLEAELRALHGSLAALEIPDGEHLYASHPAYRYLAARHAWAVVDLDLDPRAPPDPATLGSVAESLERARGRILLWESEPLPAVAQGFADLGLESVVYDPAENPPAGADFLAIQRGNAQRLAAALAAR